MNKLTVPENTKEDACKLLNQQHHIHKMNAQCLKNDGIWALGELFALCIQFTMYNAMYCCLR